MKSVVKNLAPYKAWLIVGLILSLSLFVRLRLREIPLERDEGEYAYAGQLMLQGIPPYKEAYNMKLPGTYAAYALIMAVFGQTPSGIHTGLALVNAASIIVMYLLGRKILDDTAGMAAAVAFGLLSLSPSVLGLAAHATHFVTLFAIAGTVVLLRAVQRQADAELHRSEQREQSLKQYSLSVFSVSSCKNQLFLSGLLFGLSFLMKQHGIFFGIFGGLYLLATQLSLVRSPSSRRQRNRGSRFTRSSRRSPTETHHVSRRPVQSSKLDFRTFVIRHSSFVIGLALPYLVTCLLLWLAGVFPQFWFWTVSYASKYASAVPVIYGPDVLKTALDVVIGPHLLFWILALAGAVWMWWDERFDKSEIRMSKSETSPKSEIKKESPASFVIRHSSFVIRHFVNPAPRSPLHPPHRRFLLVAFLVASFLSVSVGFHYRNHYFITLLPALALLGSVAFSRGVHLLATKVKTLELFLALTVVALSGIALLVSLTFEGPVWFGMTPEKAEMQIFRTTSNREAAKMADYIRAHTSKDARIAVVGSEPEIYFLSHRQSATGYIYMYPLMEDQSYAPKMQDDMIAEIEHKPGGPASFPSPPLEERVGERRPFNPETAAHISGASPSLPPEERVGERRSSNPESAAHPSEACPSLPPEERVGERRSFNLAPEYVVYANDDLSWLRKPNSIRKIDDWWKTYWANNLELIDTVPIKEWRGDTPDAVPAVNANGSAKCLILLKRTANKR